MRLSNLGRHRNRTATAKPTLLHDVIRLGIAKLQGAISPKTQQDLEHLLLYLAPRGGGVGQLRKVIEAATTSPGPISQNKEWWVQLFGVFGQVPQEIRDEVMRLAAAEAERTSRLYYGMAGATPPSTPKPAPDPEKLQTYLRAKAEREEAAKRLAQLKDQYAQLMGGHDPAIKVESMDALRNAIANPAYARQQLQSKALAHENERIAKMVVRTLVQRMSAYFHAKLAQHGVTPEEVVEMFEIYRQQRLSGQPINPNLKARMQQIIRLMKH